MKKKKVIIIIGIVLALIVGLLVFYICTKEDSDAVKFKKEYESYNNVIWKDNNISGKYFELNIDKNNPIVYLNDDTVLKAMKNGSKIIYFGFPNCNWCRSMVPVLLEVSKDNGLEKVYYYPFRDLRNRYEKGDPKAEKIYDEIVKLMGNNISTDFDSGKKKGKKKITAPTVIVTNKGKVIAYHKDTVDSHRDYSKKLDQKQENELYKIYEDMVLDLIMCKDDC